MLEENVTSDNVTDLDCPVWTDKETDDYQIDMLSFWLEGVTQFIVAIFGLIGNSISAFILSRYVSFRYLISNPTTYSRCDM